MYMYSNIKAQGGGEARDYSKANNNMQPSEDGKSQEDESRAIISPSLCHSLGPPEILLIGLQPHELLSYNMFQDFQIC